MQTEVKILRNTSEPCQSNGKNSMTIYFDKTPTCRQIMIAVGALKSGYRLKPNLKSKNLKFGLSKIDDMVRCQIID